MENILLVIHLIVALCLIGIVLIQRSEGGGLGMGGGGGGGATGGRPGISPLGKLTWFFGVAFVITSISLTIIAARNATGGSVLDNTLLPPAAEQQAVPEVPSGDALLPPSSDAAPATPPRVDE